MGISARLIKTFSPSPCRFATVYPSQHSVYRSLRSSITMVTTKRAVAFLSTLLAFGGVQGATQGE